MLYLDIPPAGADDKWAVVSRVAGDAGLTLELSKGVPVAERYPDDPTQVRMSFDQDRTGLALPSLIRNFHGLLILDKTVATELRAELELGPVELLDLALINHKGRLVREREYVFLNPLSIHPIAHPSAELLRFETSGNPYACERWVLDARALSGLPDLVRPQVLPRNYFVSPRLAAFVAERGYTNFSFEDVEII